MQQKKLKIIYNFERFFFRRFNEKVLVWRKRERERREKAGALHYQQNTGSGLSRTRVEWVSRLSCWKTTLLVSMNPCGQTTGSSPEHGCRVLYSNRQIYIFHSSFSELIIYWSRFEISWIRTLNILSKKKKKNTLCNNITEDDFRKFFSSQRNRETVL